ncbi:MAG TPA: type I-Fv CRISPR-associated protein Cas5fv [Arsenophonus nasoniae]|uniref:type I-Fv CRISPR-associated protein Cas5fv n=1 Tax=Arsenophonus nasoniae TaxID=638 RepID=UPI003879C59B
MQIIIEYEASWRNSFLDGSNNEELQPKGRKFIASNQELKKKNTANFKYRPISKDTIIGILNRLIGEQRKLYQARQDPDYYFKTIESILTEQDIKDNATLTQELVFIRNMSGEDPNSFTGMIKSNDPAFKSDFSPQLWGTLFLSLDEVIQFVLNDDFQFTPSIFELEPIVIINRLEELKKIKPIKLSDESQKAFDHIQNRFSNTLFKFTAKGLFIPISFYTSALYIQISRLQTQYDLTHILTKQGNISGIAKTGSITPKDFMGTYTTGKKKLVWGNPYILKEKKKGEGEVVQSLTKASGRLAITLNIPKEQARDLEQKIEDAGVSSFYIGKKGLAYVTDIRI